VTISTRSPGWGCGQPNASSPRSASTWPSSRPPRTSRRGAGRCPGNNVTGGKRHSGRTRHSSVWLGDILTECAWAAARSRGTHLGAQFWRLARRIGKKKAAVAVGHSILVIAWHLLTDDADYADLGGDYFVKRDAQRARSRAIGQLEALGYRVTLEAA
jgi:hypothetical protein